MNILIVDDDDVDRSLIIRSLVFMDLVTMEVGTGSACLSVLDTNRFDCIILDHMLPDCDSLELTAKIRNKGVTTPIIILTGHGDELLAVKVFKAGANDYIPKKDITPERLTETVKAVVEKISVDTFSILIVDDSDTDRMNLIRLLKLPNLQISEANCGKICLKLVAEKGFDCILLDHRLPDYESPELMSKIRNSGTLTPIIVITSYGDELLVAQLFKAGANDYIPKKHLTQEVLTVTVKTAVENHKKHMAVLHKSMESLKSIHEKADHQLRMN